MVYLKRQLATYSHSHKITETLILKKLTIHFTADSKHNSITPRRDVISYRTRVKPEDITHDVPNPQTTSIM